MIDHAFDQMMHRPIDDLLIEANTIKEKVYQNCELTEKIHINGYDFVIHHYNKKKKNVIFYFPGGAFINSPTLLHFRFAKKAAKKLKCHIMMVQYPLFPEIDPKTTTNLVKKIINKYKKNNIMLMGDSAGANLALMVLSSLQNDNNNIVNKAIIISPWIDAKLDNEDINLIKQYDFILEKRNCQEIAKNLYLKYLNNKTYLCPSNEYKYKCDILLLSGGHEIFTPDAILWTKKQELLNVKHYVFKNMCHCFIIFPIIEAKKALNLVKKFIYTID